MSVTEAGPEPSALAPSRSIELLPSATLAVLAGAALGAGASAGPVALTVALAALQLALILSWVPVLALPGRIGTVVLGLIAAGAADAGALRYYEHGYESALGVLGLAMPLMFCHQLVRGVVRSRVVESLSGIALLVVAVSAGSGLLLLIRQDGGRHEVLAIAAAAAAALFCSHLVDAVVPRPRFDPEIDRGLLGLVLGVAAASGAGFLTLHAGSDLATSRSLIVGAGVGAVACLVSVGASFIATGSELADRRRGLVPVVAILATMMLSIPAGYFLITALSS